MVQLSLLVGAVMACTAAAFAPSPPAQPAAPHVALHATANRASSQSYVQSKVDPTGNNLAIKDFLVSAEASGLLTKVARSGLLSKLSAAGISLSALEPLILGAADAGLLDEVLILTEAAGPDVLPLLPTIVDLAPGALPLLAAAVGFANPTLLTGAAAASAAAAVGIVALVPDDTVLQVAGQTLGVAVLGLAAPVALLGGAAVLGKVKAL